MKHTQGKWEIVEATAYHGFYIESLQGTVCDLYFEHPSKKIVEFENAEANARLIAAAPLMYEALKNLRDTYKILMEDCKYEATQDGLIKQMDAALAAAEGRK